MTDQTKTKYPNNLKALRIAAKLTQEDVARVWNATKDAVSKAENGKVGLTPKKTRLLTEHFGWTATQIQGGKEKKVPILGYVGAGERVYPIDDLPLINDFGESEMINCDFADYPPGELKQDLVALRVKGASMEPFLREGSLIYYGDKRSGGFEEFVNHHVVCFLPNGQCYLKILKRGTQPGRFNLLSHNASMMEDIEVEACAKVLFVKMA